MQLDLQVPLLLAYGLHVGHSLRNSFIGSAWMIAALRGETTLINLWKTINSLKATFSYLSNIVSYLGPIWFITFNPVIQQFVKVCASYCGEFSVTTQWVRGAVSNFWVVLKTFRTISQTSELVLSSKYKSYKPFLANWHYTRFTWPRAVFISNLENAYFAAKESQSLGIPSFGVVDTNIASQAVVLPIPGNDESLLSLIFSNDLISNYIIVRKFSLVLMWFLNIRAVSRLVSFSEWLTVYYKKLPKVVPDPFIVFQSLKTSTANNVFKGVALFLSQNFAATQVVEQLSFKSATKVIKNFSIVLSQVLRRRSMFAGALRVEFIKRAMAMRRNPIKRRFLTNTFFKTKLLTSRFTLKFLRSRYTLGRFRTERIRVNNKAVLKKTSFLNTVANMFFYSRFIQHRIPDFYAAYYLTKASSYEYFESVVKALATRYSSKENLISSAIGIPNLIEYEVNLIAFKAYLVLCYYVYRATVIKKHNLLDKLRNFIDVKAFTQGLGLERIVPLTPKRNLAITNISRILTFKPLAAQSKAVKKILHILSETSTAQAENIVVERKVIKYFYNFKKAPLQFYVSNFKFDSFVKDRFLEHLNIFFFNSKTIYSKIYTFFFTGRRIKRPTFPSKYKNNPAFMIYGFLQKDVIKTFSFNKVRSHNIYLWKWS